MTDGVDSELVGITRTQVLEQVIGVPVQTSVPTYTTSMLSSPSRGSQTLTSVVKPLITMPVSYQIFIDRACTIP